MRRGPQGPPPLWLIVLVLVALLVVVLLVVVLLVAAVEIGFPYLMEP